MVIKEDTGEIKLPDFMVVGAGKSGTTSIYRILSQHPDVFLPKIKETWFFQLITNPNKEILNRLDFLPTTFEEYLKLYSPAVKGQICGEVTPCYLQFPEYAIPNIKKYHPEWEQLKIIIILREPIDKILSQYRFQLKIKMETLPLNKALDPKTEEKRIKDMNTSVGLRYVQSALYADSVRKYIENFPRVKVFTFDQLKNDPEQVYRQIFSFLDVEYLKGMDVSKKYNTTELKKRSKSPSLRQRLIKLLYTYPVLQILLNKENRIKLRQKFYHKISEKDMNKRTLNYLKDIFRQDVMQLEEVAGLDLSNWKKKYE